MYPQAPPARRTPGTVVTVRVLVVLQLAGLLVVGVLALVLVGFSGTGLDSRDELTRGFSGLGIILGSVLAVGALLAAVALGLPVFLLRGNRPRGCTVALVFLAVVEGLVGLLLLAGVAASLASRDPGSAVVPFLGALVPIAVVVLLLLPVTRAWAAPPSAPTWNPAPAWNPPPPPGPWGPA